VNEQARLHIRITKLIQETGPVQTEWPCTDRCLAAVCAGRDSLRDYGRHGELWDAVSIGVDACRAVLRTIAEHSDANTQDGVCSLRSVSRGTTLLGKLHSLPPSG